MAYHVLINLTLHMRQAWWEIHWGGGFSHASELKFMKYKEAMSTPDKQYWEDYVDTEHKKFVEKCVW